ncbi:MAG: hypothetical protein U0271_45415 [Polyangiaceae bacterium]
MRWTLGVALVAVACAACGDDAVTDGGASSGGSPSTGGLGGGGGSPSVGGQGGGGTGAGGAPVPGPVPGCEVLALAGDPELFATPPFPPLETEMALASLDGDRAGLTYLRGWADSAELRSRTIDGAFTSWPPTVSDPTVQFQGFIANRPRLDSALPNGLFSMGFGPYGVYSFDSTSVVRPFEDTWSQAFLEPQTGVLDIVTFDFNALTFGLLVFDSVDATVPSASSDIPIGGCKTVRMATSGDNALFSIATDYYCDEAPRVDFFRKSANGVELVGGFDLPVKPLYQSLAPRADGGYWYFVSSNTPGQGSYAYALDADGAVVGDPWHDDYAFGDFAPQFLPWRDGFVGTHRDGKVSIFVTDGFNRTSAPPLDGTDTQALASRSPLAVAIGGVDSGSFLVAYPTMEGILMARFDCVTPL